MIVQARETRASARGAALQVTCDGVDERSNRNWMGGPTVGRWLWSGGDERSSTSPQNCTEQTETRTEARHSFSGPSKVKTAKVKTALQLL